MYLGLDLFPEWGGWKYNSGRQTGLNKVGPERLKPEGKD